MAEQEGITTEPPVSKDEILNKVIAIGLNSLVGSMAYNKEHSDLVEKFSKTSLKRIVSLWPYLNDNIKFFVFKFNIDLFYKFLNKQLAEEEAAEVTQSKGETHVSF